MTKTTSFGGVSGGSGIDIKDLDFSNETVNDTQKKIVAVATNSAKYGISARSGYCQAWVADVYQAVTGSRGSAHCALCAADMVYQVIGAKFLLVQQSMDILQVNTVMLAFISATVWLHIT